MVRIKNIIGSDANIEDQVNKFLEQCDEKGHVVRNITFTYAEEYDSFNVFVEYEVLTKEK
mgnify:CR=1 FL=1